MTVTTYIAIAIVVAVILFFVTAPLWVIRKPKIYLNMIPAPSEQPKQELKNEQPKPVPYLRTPAEQELAEKIEFLSLVSGSDEYKAWIIAHDPNWQDPCAPENEDIQAIRKRLNMPRMT